MKKVEFMELAETVLESARGIQSVLDSYDVEHLTVRITKGYPIRIVSKDKENVCIYADDGRIADCEILSSKK